MSATRGKNAVRSALCAVAMAIFAAAGVGPASAGEVTGAADNLRTGWYPDEPTLTPAQITKERFVQVFKDELHGQIYAQPLVANRTLLVVTEENWAYGLDPVTGGVRWEKQFGVAVEAGAEKSEKTIKCPDIEPRVGVTGTPVIDTEHNVAYFVANRYVSGSSGAIGWYMNAVSLSTGETLPGFPVKIEGEATNLVSEKVKFVPVQQLQRPALLMMNGVVYAAFGSHCDRTPYEGWIVGVSSEGNVVTKWATSSHEAPIWQSGGGLVSDTPGQILFATGNGPSSEPGLWDPPEGSGKQEPAPEGKLGEAVVRVEAKVGGELATKDYFSPFNSKELDEKDLDLGSSAPVALPSPYFGNAKVPHLLVQEGKGGAIYLLNRDGLGGRGAAKNNVVQELTGFARVFGAAGVWPGEGGYVDLATVGGHLHFFKYGEKSGEPALVSETKSSEEMAFGSGSPIITSNGTSSGSGVLWITWCPKTACVEAEAELRAYNPASGEGAKPLWQEKIGLATKFSRPGVSNGHIYIGNHEGHLISFSAKAPTVVTGAASAVTQTSATLNASVNPNGVEVGECKFEYGATTSYGSSAPCTPAPGSGTNPVAVSAAVTGLSPNTTYHFTVVAKNVGGTSSGSDQTFTTLLPPPPTVVTGAASAVAQTSATLNATVNPNGVQVSECKFEYGPTEAYGSSAPCTPPPGSGTGAIPVSAALESLAENTTYHFRIFATDANGTSVGADATFKTLLVLGPHWYANGVRLGEGTLENGQSIFAWGHLTLTNTKVGAVTCQTLVGGDLANPTGGGAGKGAFEGVTLYDCEEPTCEGAKGLPEVIAEKLEWSSVLIEEAGGVFRDRIEGIVLREICVGTAGNVEFHGMLKPNIEPGTSIGAAPSKLEFGAGSGELQSVEGAGTVAARLKLMGFEGGELIRARNT
jgi:hypothetical protein